MFLLFATSVLEIWKMGRRGDRWQTTHHQREFDLRPLQAIQRVLARPAGESLRQVRRPAAVARCGARRLELCGSPGKNGRGLLFRVCGSYADMNAGSPAEALMDFTGGVHVSIQLSEPPHYLWGLMLRAGQTKSLMSSGTQQGVSRSESTSPTRGGKQGGGGIWWGSSTEEGGFGPLDHHPVLIDGDCDRRRHQPTTSYEMDWWKATLTPSQEWKRWRICPSIRLAGSDEIAR